MFPRWELDYRKADWVDGLIRLNGINELKTLTESTSQPIPLITTTLIISEAYNPSSACLSNVHPFFAKVMNNCADK